MFVYISSEKNINLLDDIARQKRLMINKITNVYDIKKTVNQQTANYSHCTYFAIDITALQNSDNEITEAINTFSAMYPDTTIIVIYLDAKQDNSLLSELRKQDIVVITDGKALYKDLSTMFSKPESVIDNDFSEFSENAVVKEVVKEIEVERVVVKRLKQHVTISFCGTQGRIGTTTQAMQTAVYLLSQGVKVCYIDVFDMGNALAHYRVYGGTNNEQSGYLNYLGLDMFYKYNLPLVVAMGYEFIILDFGVFDTSKIQNYITSDIKVLVSGTKPLEMGYLFNFFESIDIVEGINYIFSFAPESQHPLIIEQMEILAKSTYFAPYTPSYFENSSIAVYQKIVGDYLTMPEPKEPPTLSKKSFFTRFKK